MALEPPSEPLLGAAESPVQTAHDPVGRAYGHLLVPRMAQPEVGLFIYFFGVSGMGVAATFLAIRFAPAIGTPLLAIGFLLFALVGVGLWICFRWDHLAGGAMEDLAAFPTANRRVWCVGTPAAHARWRSLGPIDDNSFEPEIFAAPFAMRAGWWMQTAWIAAAAAVYGAFYLFMFVLGTPPTRWFDLYLFYGSIAAGVFLVTAIRPTSIRIVPGRIDIMRGWFFQTSRPVVRSIPLRDRRVVMDLRSGIMFVTHPATNWQADATVAFGTPRHKARIAHVILRAAISTAEPPTLPDAEAVG